MPKLIFTADWHIKTKFKDIPTEWLLFRYETFLTELENIRKENDVTTLVIGGDIFDAFPTIFDLVMFQKLFYITNFDHYVLFPGNHELLNKHQSFYKYIHAIYSLQPNVTFIYDEASYYGDWLILPYPIVKNYTDSLKNQKVMTHVRGPSPAGLYDAEVDFSMFESAKLVLSGDIHQFYKPLDNFWYPGPPMDTSTVRYGPENPRYVLLVDGEDVSEIKLTTVPRILKAVVTSEEYDRLKDIAAKSPHWIEFEVQIDNVKEFIDMQTDTKTKKVLVTESSNSLVTDAKDIEHRIYDFLVNYLNISEEEAAKVVAVYKSL